MPAAAVVLVSCHVNLVAGSQPPPEDVPARSLSASHSPTRLGPTSRAMGGIGFMGASSGTEPFAHSPTRHVVEPREARKLGPGSSPILMPGRAAVRGVSTAHSRVSLSHAHCGFDVRAFLEGRDLSRHLDARARLSSLTVRAFPKQARNV